AIVTVMDFNTVRVQVAVPESESPLVVKGQPVQIQVEGLPGRVFQGQVTRFAYALDEATKTMLAEAELPNPKLELRPGMYASVKIGIERKTGALLLPSDAVFMEKAGASVFTSANGKAKKVTVKIGFQDGTNIEIVSGITPETSVLLVGKRPIQDGQSVTVVEAK
ncbi:MAG: efflux RND transporter periplasmic adaptor subunit, partial [Verrucomicrobiota bacterium]